MSVETVEKEYGDTESRRVARWFEEIDLASKVEKDWRGRAEKVVKRYRDEQEAPGSQFNILWSNTETMRPALYSATPKADVQRRYKDADPIGAAVAKVLERAVSFSVDDEDFDGIANQIVTDYLLPGRAIARVRYQPTLAEKDNLIPLQGVAEGDAVRYFDGETEVESEKVEFADGAPFLRGEPLEEVVYEEAPVEYVHWKRFRMAPAEQWSEVRWVAFQTFMSRDELVEAFGEIGWDVPLTLASNGERVEEMENPPDEFFQRAELWEIWDKQTRKVCVIAVGFDKYLMEKDDPLKLKGFFPVPKPLYAVMTNGTMVPVPEFCLYQDQADELNMVTARIERLVDALKVRGLYDAQFKTYLHEMLRSDETYMVPVEGWAGFAEKGGMEGIISWMPIEQIGKVLAALYQKRAELIDTIYQLTGISDIQRGSTDARETKGAQQLKAQFGSRRLMPRQKEVQRFFRDLYRLKAEIIAEHFSPQTLSLMTGVQVPPEAVMVLRSDVLRAFKVDIETDSTVAPDDQAEKAAVAEYLTAIQGAVGTFAPLVQEGAMPHETAKAILLAVTRRSKFGRELEGELERMPPPQPKSDPKAQQMQAEAQMEQQRFQMDAQKSQADFQLEQQKAQMELQVERERMMMERERHQQEMVMAREKHVLEMQRMREEATLKAQTQALLGAQKIELAERAAEERVEN